MHYWFLNNHIKKPPHSWALKPTVRPAVITLDDPPSLCAACSVFNRSTALSGCTQEYHSRRISPVH